MKRLTLGLRLGLSFGALILLMCLLGGLAVWRMELGTSTAQEVHAKRVPKVAVVQALTDSVWESRFHIHAYVLEEDADSLRRGRKGIAAAKVSVQAAADLVKQYPDMVTMAQGATECADGITDFEELVDQMEAEHKSQAAQMIALVATGKAYLQLCSDLRNSQQLKLDSEIEAKAEPAVIQERLAKVRLIEDLSDTGNTIRTRVENIKAQAARDLDSLRDTLKSFTALDNLITRLSLLMREQVDIDQLAAIRESADSYKTGVEQIVQSRTAVRAGIASLADAAEYIGQRADGLAEDGLLEIEKDSAKLSDGLILTSWIVMVGLAVALIAGVLVAWLSTRSITGPIREGVSALASTAKEISSTIAQLASNASQAAAAVAETTTTVDEIRQTAQVAADKARAVADNAQGAATAAETGRQATDRTVDGLNGIRGQMSSIGESITRLSEQSQAVGDIVSTVTDLAEQSNLLAVNASIEAAKAGDAGKGFAVVAQEIRTLAEQSKDSTKQVRSILTEVQKATGKAVLATEQGSQSVADGGRQAEEAGQSIRTLAATIQDATRAAVQIAASSQQQLAGMEQVSRAMENIKQATAQNAEGARQLGAAAHSLKDVGQRLKSLVDARGDLTGTSN